jgi:uncharacterized membrane protein
MKEVAPLFWLAMLVFAVLVVILLAGLLRWALTDPDIERQIAKDLFEAEQDFRARRRSGLP